MAELDTVPDEYLPFVFQLIRSFHDNVLLKPVADSFCQGWQEALEGVTYPAASLWNDMNDE